MYNKDYYEMNEQVYEDYMEILTEDEQEWNDFLQDMETHPFGI